MAELYGFMLEAERLGQRVLPRILEVAPEGPIRDFTRVQLADETRHVELFTRVTGLLGWESRRSPRLLEMERGLAGVRDCIELAAHLQVIENAANVLFFGVARKSRRLLRSGIRLPGGHAVETLLATVIDLVGADESAHVAFGMRLLRARLPTITLRERRVIEEQVQRTCALMQGLVSDAGTSYRAVGLTDVDVLRRTGDAQRRYWRHLEIDPAVESGA